MPNYLDAFPEDPAEYSDFDGDGTEIMQMMMMVMGQMMKMTCVQTQICHITLTTSQSFIMMVVQISMRSL